MPEVEVEHVTVTHEVTSQSTEHIEVGEGIPAQVIVSETGLVGPRGIQGPTGPQGIQGVKGDPGGIGTATSYSGDLNNLTTPGIYEVMSSTNVPVSGFMGIVLVTTSPIGIINQTAMVAGRSFIRLGFGAISGAWIEYGTIGKPDGAPFKGTGFPEGVVTAPVGARYIDTAATNGAIEWIKTSGTGNTGWKVFYGDTGSRLLFAAGSIAGAPNMALYIRRINETVTLTLVEPTAGGTISGAYTFTTTLDAAFRADSVGSNTSVVSGVLTDNVGIDRGTFYTIGGTIGARGLVSGVRHYAGLTYTTTASWPSTLPGTAA